MTEQKPARTSSDIVVMDVAREVWRFVSRFTLP
jgi:hypothetical protein